MQRVRKCQSPATHSLAILWLTGLRCLCWSWKSGGSSGNSIANCQDDHRRANLCDSVPARDLPNYQNLALVTSHSKAAILSRKSPEIVCTIDERKRTGYVVWCEIACRFDAHFSTHQLPV